MTRLILFIGLLAMTVAACTPARNASQQTDQQTPASSNENLNQEIFSLVLTDYNGNPVALSDFLGRPLVLNSWASWCPFCVDELPDFAKVQQALDEQVTIIAINRRESRKIAQGFSNELGVTQSLIMLLDPGDEFYRSIGGFAMPETLFIDNQGNIIEHTRGPLTEAQIRQKLEQLL